MTQLTLHLFNKRMGEEGKLLPAIEEMDQEHMKRNAKMMNKGGGQKQKDHNMTMNRKNEGKRGVVRSLVDCNKPEHHTWCCLRKNELHTKKMALKTNNIKIITPTTIQARITILKKGPRT
jgi:hypothetical protein